MVNLSLMLIWKFLISFADFQTKFNGFLPVFCINKKFALNIFFQIGIFNGVKICLWGKSFKSFGNEYIFV